MDEGLSEIVSFDGEISDNGTIKIPGEHLQKLKQTGIKKIRIVLYGKTEDSVNALGYDAALFNKIREVQRLPDNVVLDFLKCRNSIGASEFKVRIGF